MEKGIQLLDFENIADMLQIHGAPQLRPDAFWREEYILYIPVIDSKSNPSIFTTMSQHLPASLH